MHSLITLLVEPAMYVAIGFLAAALMSLPFFGVAHRRAERLTRQHLDTLLPMSVREMEAEKDQLRAEHAMSAQRLEATVDDLKAKMVAQKIELGQHSGAVAKLKVELDDRAQAAATIEAREAALKQQLRAIEQEHALQSVHLEDARHALRGKEADLARIATDLATRSAIAEQQNVELARTRAEMAAIEAAAADEGRARDDVGRQLADERGKRDALAQEHARASALLDEARSALRDKEEELAGLATELTTGAAIIEQQDLELARARTEVAALQLAAEADRQEREALHARLAHYGDATDAAGRQLADERGRAQDLGQRIGDLEAELIAQRDAADALTHLTASRICDQARRLAEHEYESERLHTALDAARRAEAGLRYELTKVEERRMLESKAALAEKAALEIQVARLQLDREQRHLEAANGGHANGAASGHGAPADPHVVRLDPMAARERRAREEPAAPHPGAS
jgi:chromosome segregation ATPase